MNFSLSTNVGLFCCRNGCTGEVVSVAPKSSLSFRYLSRRVRRTRLQSSLIAQVSKGIIQLRKKLLSLEDLGDRGVRLRFEDGEQTIADLVVGGDGIRSVGRSPILLRLRPIYH